MAAKWFALSVVGPTKYREDQSDHMHLSIFGTNQANGTLELTLTLFIISELDFGVG